jgi:hypothetical protein
MKLRPLWLPILGFAVILVVCTYPLGASIYNRSGTPESAFRLSERELELPDGKGLGEPENTPLTLQLIWRVEPTDQADSAATIPSATRAAWITRSKVVQLGIPIRVGPDTYVSTFLVLEFDGPAHARAVSRACDPASPTRDERTCEFEVKKSSRIFVVDAGRTVAELRARYADRTHFAVVSGEIKLSAELKSGEFAGYVNGLSVDTVQGIEPLRSTIDPATGEMLWHRLRTPHFFDAVIAFGRRLEPWNVSIEGRESGAASTVAIPTEGRERGLPDVVMGQMGRRPVPRCNADY